jgi:hypothetical protein
MAAPSGAWAGSAPTAEIPAPRSLEKLLKQVEKGTQVRRSGLDGVLDELKQHRDATTDAELRGALDQLCARLARFLENPTRAQSNQLLAAIEAVKRALAGAGRAKSKRRFWT